MEALTPRILKEDKNMRECMVYLVLHYLASGETFQLSEVQFLIGQTTISCIVTDACQALFVILRPCYGKKPRNTGKWLEIADKFYQQYDFTNGISIIDGKHIVMEQLFNSGFHYKNYKGMDSTSYYWQ